MRTTPTKTERVGKHDDTAERSSSRTRTPSLVLHFVFFFLFFFLKNPAACIERYPSIGAEVEGGCGGPVGSPQGASYSPPVNAVIVGAASLRRLARPGPALCIKTAYAGPDQGLCLRALAFANRGGARYLHGAARAMCQNSVSAVTAATAARKSFQEAVAAGWGAGRGGQAGGKTKETIRISRYLGVVISSLGLLIGGLRLAAAPPALWDPLGAAPPFGYPRPGPLGAFGLSSVLLLTLIKRVPPGSLVAPKSIPQPRFAFPRRYLAWVGWAVRCSSA